MANFTIDYKDERARLEARFESIIADYQRLLELLLNMGCDVDDPDTVINAMFDSSTLETLKTKEFETFANAIHIPMELRDEQLRLMLAGIPEECKELFRNICEEFRRDTEGLNITPSDIRFHYRKFQLTEEKKTALLATTHYTLTDEEQRDCEMLADIIKKLRILRGHNNWSRILNLFVASRMEPEKDRPLDELAKVVHENRCASKEEIEAARQAQLEKERREAEEWEREKREAEEQEAKERQRNGVFSNVEPFLQEKWNAITEYQRTARRKGIRYGTQELNADGQTTDEEADRIRESIGDGHGERVFIR